MSLFRDGDSDQLYPGFPLGLKKKPQPWKFEIRSSQEKSQEKMQRFRREKAACERRDQLPGQEHLNEDGRDFEQGHLSAPHNNYNAYLAHMPLCLLAESMAVYNSGNTRDNGEMGKRRERYFRTNAGTLHCNTTGALT